MKNQTPNSRRQKENGKSNEKQIKILLKKSEFSLQLQNKTKNWFFL